MIQKQKYCFFCCQGIVKRKMAEKYRKCNFSAISVFHGIWSGYGRSKTE